MERIFRDHTKDMLSAIIIRAELKAYESRIQAVADEMVDEIEKNKTFTYKTVSAGKAIDDGTPDMDYLLQEVDGKPRI